MRVWILQTGEPLHIDGAEVRPMRAMNLAKALTAAGHRVVLWSSSFYHQEKRHRFPSFHKVEVSPQLEIRLIPSCGYERNVGLARIVDHLQMARNLLEELNKVVDDELPATAFVGFPPIETAAVMIGWLAKRGIPSLLDAKDQWPDIFVDALPSFARPAGRLALAPYFHFAKRAMRNATGICAMAEGFLTWALAAAGRERGMNDGIFPLTTPPAQISAEQLQEAQRWWEARGIARDGRRKICFVGSMSPAFDFHDVLVAARALRAAPIPYELVICGDGDAAAALKKAAWGLDNVIFPGWINRQQMLALYERSQAVLLPYRNRRDFVMSIPNKVFDALAFGLPLLSPLQGEVAELIESQGVGLRYGTDSGRTLYDCIQHLAADETLRQEMSANARRLFEERFSYEKVYGGLVEHLERMAASGSE